MRVPADTYTVTIEGPVGGRHVGTRIESVAVSSATDLGDISLDSGAIVSGLLLLPFASITLLGLVPLGFPGDRFYTVATVALVPPVALGLCGLLDRVRGSVSILLGAASQQAQEIDTMNWKSAN